MKEIARELGVTDQTLYNGKSKYGGREVADAKRLRALEDENRRLKGQWEQGSRKGSQIQMKHSFLFALFVTVAAGAYAQEQAAKPIVEAGFTVEERYGTSY